MESSHSKKLYLFETPSGYFFTSKNPDLKTVKIVSKLLGLSNIPYPVWNPQSYTENEECSLVNLSTYNKCLEDVNEKLKALNSAGQVESGPFAVKLLCLLASRQQLISFKKFANKYTENDEYSIYISTLGN